MRVIVDKRDPGFTEVVALLDCAALLASGRSLDADGTAIADAEAWAQRAAGANGFGAPETAEL